MSTKLIAANVLLAALAVLFAVWLMRDLAASRPLPAAPAPRKMASASLEQPAPDSNPKDQLPAYNVIVSKYLFNPSRTEGAPDTGGKAAAQVPLPPKPVLLGVVVDGSTSRAYLEDPSTKRVFGYQVGDNVAGGRLEKITDDRVQISRPDGVVEVTLRDPTKPRPAPPVAAAPPGAAGAPPGAVPPGAPTAGPQNPPVGVRPPIPPRSLRRMPAEQLQQQQPASQ